MNNSYNQKGFSLIEVIIYVSLTVVILVVGTNLLFTILSTREEVRPRRIVENESYFVLDHIASHVRKAESILDSSSTTTLRLEMADSSINPTEFTVKNEKVAMRQGGNSWQYITSDKVEIVELVFKDLTPPESPGVVRIKLHLKPIPALGGRPEIEVKSSVTLRE